MHYLPQELWILLYCLLWCNIPRNQGNSRKGKIPRNSYDQHIGITIEEEKDEIVNEEENHWRNDDELEDIEGESTAMLSDSENSR